MTTTPHAAPHSHDSAAERSVGTASKLIGVLGQFDDPDSLIGAAEHARLAGYKQIDAYSPFPVHGIDDALGIRRSRLPFFVLAIGIGGCCFGLFMQWYCNAAYQSPIFPGYNFIVSGKPFWSLPANIPVTFEVIVLSSAFATFFGMLFLNRLPRLANPLHRISRFKRATNDRFFLLIDQSDTQFDRERIEQQLNEWGASGIEEVREDLTDQKLPAWMKSAAFVLALLLLLPPVLIYRAHYGTNPQPRLHVIPDMDWQYRFRPQTVGPHWDVNREEQYFFADIKSMREPIPGTIARGDLRHDIELYQGIKADSLNSASAAGGESVSGRISGPRLQDSNQEPAGSESADQEPVDQATADPAAAQEPAQDPAAQDPAAQDPAVGAGDVPQEPEPDWVTEFPAALTIDDAMMQRGRDRYQIYCTVCHGYAGKGNGLVNQRAMELAVSNVIQKGTTANATWTEAKSFHDPTVTVQPVGRIFDTITNGRGTMGPYGRQISVQDRWAIVLYVKALQATRAGEPQPEPQPPAGAANPPPAGDEPPAAGDPQDENATDTDGAQPGDGGGAAGDGTAGDGTAGDGGGSND